jgi:hypothetical protein
MACTVGPSTGGQLAALADPAPYTETPYTWPTGSNPTLRMAANSPQLSEDPHVPLARIPAIRAAATGGSSSLTPSRLVLQPHFVIMVWRGMPVS